MLRKGIGCGMNNTNAPSLGEYRLTRQNRFRVGYSAFDLQKGGIVNVTQYDGKNQSILVDFGGGDRDWLSESLIGDLFEPVNKNAPTNEGLRFYDGNVMDPDTKSIEGGEIRAVSPDGRTAFTIRLVRGQPSIEISTFATFRLNGVLYDNQLAIQPEASNRIAITAMRCPE
jgi:hypothetical protein